MTPLTSKHNTAFSKIFAVQRQSIHRISQFFIACLGVLLLSSPQVNSSPFLNTQRRRNEFYQSIKQHTNSRDSSRLTQYTIPFNRTTATSLVSYCNGIAKRVNPPQLNANKEINWRHKTKMVEANLNHTSIACKSFRSAILIGTELYRYTTGTKDFAIASYLSTLLKQISTQTKSYNFYRGDIPEAFKNNNLSYLTKKISLTSSETDDFIQKNSEKELMSKEHVSMESFRRLKLFSLTIGLLLFTTVVSFVKTKKQFRELQESNSNLLRKNSELNKATRELHNPPTHKTKGNKPPEIDQKILKRLEQQLIEEQAFSDPNLSLKSLAKILNTNTSYLSALINTQYKCNFKTLINRLRVDQTKKMLISPEFKGYCMEGIAEQAGFKSRSSFYNSFKLHTGLTPSQYKANSRLPKLKDTKNKSKN